MADTERLILRSVTVLSALALIAGCTSRGGFVDAPSSVVESLTITARKPAFGGASFGNAGAYEYIAGVASVKVDPSHAANRGIVDLKAAAGPDGWVHYKTDVVVLRPTEAARASRTLVVEIANRGNKLALGRLADGATQFDTPQQAGNGWFMRQGHTLAWIGWQGDVPLGKAGQVVGTEFPVARAGDKPIVGETVEEFVFDDTEKRSRGQLTYPVADATVPARVEVRTTPGSAASVLPSTAWRFVDATTIEITVPQPSMAVPFTR